MFLLLILWNYKCKKIKWHYFISFLIILSILPVNFSSELSDLNNAVIKEAKSNYVIAETGNQDVIVYSEQLLFEKDEIVLKGKGSEIESLSNFYGYNFKEWCKKRQIAVSYNDNDIVSVNQKDTFKRYIYKKVQNISDDKIKTWINQVLFGKMMDESGIQMIHASGMHYSLLLFWLKKY